MKKIVGFGDSFVLGYELANNSDGQKSWIAQAAKELNCVYETTSKINVGNEHIAQQIYRYFANHDTKDTLAVINWTWSSRWDFYLLKNQSWVTLGPTCAPDKFNHVDIDESRSIVDFYKNYTGLADEWNHYRSLQAIYAVQGFLATHNILNVQTYMDHELFEINVNRSRLEHYKAYKDASWPEIDNEQDLATLPKQILEEVNSNFASQRPPPYIEMLQNLILPNLMTFEGTDFLTWSRNHGYPVTPTPGDHPLELAHEKAKELWKPVYAEKLGIVL